MKKAIVGRTVRFTFDGGLDPVVFDADKAGTAVSAYAEMHGWAARLGDKAALSRELPDGTVRTVTEAMRRDAIAGLVDHYHAGGAWELKASAAPARLNPQIMLLATKLGKTYAEAEAWFADQLQAQLAALGNVEVDAGAGDTE